jgi:hypothetical protein
MARRGPWWIQILAPIGLPLGRWERGEPASGGTKERGGPASGGTKGRGGPASKMIVTVRGMAPHTRTAT